MPKSSSLLVDRWPVRNSPESHDKPSDSQAWLNAEIVMVVGLRPGRNSPESHDKPSDSQAWLNAEIVIVACRPLAGEELS
jgi:hypothetical protein